MSIQKYLNPNLKPEVKNWIQVNLVNYLKDNTENQNEIDHIIDYLNSDKAPLRLKKMSYEEAKNNAIKWINALIKQGNDIMETEKDIETFLDFNNGIKFVKLVSKNSFLREGKLMAHCVGSYADKKDIIIYSLRDSKNRPHCTIEVKTKDKFIQQIQGKGNGSIHPKYIKYILKFLKKLDMKINTNYMKNLGYDSFENLPFMWKFLESNFDNIQFIMLDGVKYFYTHSKLIKK
jgi:hypothetical protein